jgi:DNA-binding NarL/FixJ family response regulator
MIRVLLADDQALVRAGFVALLDAEDGIEVVGQAADGAEAVRLASQLEPDVVLMDIRMPGLDGIESTRQIAARPALAGVHVVILTTFDLDEYVFEGLRAGAAGFLVKDTDAAELIRAVRVAAGGAALLSPTVTGSSSPSSPPGPGRPPRCRGPVSSPHASARWSRWSRRGYPTRRSPASST